MAKEPTLTDIAGHLDTIEISDDEARAFIDSVADLKAYVLRVCKNNRSEGKEEGLIEGEAMAREELDRNEMDDARAIRLVAEDIAAGRTQDALEALARMTGDGSSVSHGAAFIAREGLAAPTLFTLRGAS